MLRRMALLVLLSLASRGAAAAVTPNVLLIIADDMNRSLGCYGQTEVKTPNVDRLAARATRFTRAYCQYPVCSPSRVSFLSGRRPEHTGMYGNEGASRTPLLKDAVFLPEHLHKQGYFTARVGKVFHIGRDVPECWDVTEEGTPDNKIIYQPSEIEKLKLADNVKGSGRLDGDTGEGGSWSRLEIEDSKLIDGRTSRRVAELLDRAAGGNQPFMIACGFRRPHLPWIAPESFFDALDPAKLTLLETGTVARPGGDPKKPAATDASRRASLRAYYACVGFMDSQLGRVLEAMDRNRLWDNTIVVMIGDNGYHLGSRGGYWGKGTPYEESCGVPLLIAAPGQKAGQVCRRVVEFVDLYPTLLDLCGQPAGKGLEGRSLRPLLENPAATWDHPAYTVTAREGKLRSLSVSTERFRYVEYADAAAPVELYDIAADPHEWKNLAADPQCAKTLAEMRRLASEHRKAFW